MNISFIHVVLIIKQNRDYNKLEKNIYVTGRFEISIKL